MKFKNCFLYEREADEESEIDNLAEFIEERKKISIVKGKNDSSFRKVCWFSPPPPLPALDSNESMIKFGDVQRGKFSSRINFWFVNIMWRASVANLDEEKILKLSFLDEKSYVQ